MKGKKGIGVGFYLNRATRELVQLDWIDALLLPRAEKGFARVPSSAVVFGAPLISLAYLVFLPFAGLAALGVLIGVRLRSLQAAMARRDTLHKGIIT